MQKSQRYRSRFLYSIANQVVAFVEESDELEDDLLFEYFSDFEKIAKPNKITILHDIIHRVDFDGLEWLTGFGPELEIDMLKGYFHESEMEVPEWLTKDTVKENVIELDKLIFDASKKLVSSVFFVLFSDRAFLEKFQRVVTRFISAQSRDSFPKYMRKDGVLKRPTYVPGWLKEAVYHRDKGRCQLCWTDLTGQLTPIHNAQLDHIIPLAASGSNDPTNFQLTCVECNQRKGRNLKTTPPRFTPYW